MKGIFDAYVLWPFGKKFILEHAMLDSLFFITSRLHVGILISQHFSFLGDLHSTVSVLHGSTCLHVRKCFIYFWTVCDGYCFAFVDFICNSWGTKNLNEIWIKCSWWHLDIGDPVVGIHIHEFLDDKLKWIEIKFFLQILRSNMYTAKFQIESTFFSMFFKMTSGIF